MRVLKFAKISKMLHWTREHLDGFWLRLMLSAMQTSSSRPATSTSWDRSLRSCSQVVSVVLYFVWRATYWSSCTTASSVQTNGTKQNCSDVQSRLVHRVKVIRIFFGSMLAPSSQIWWQNLNPKAKAGSSQLLPRTRRLFCSTISTRIRRISM